MSSIGKAVGWTSHSAILIDAKSAAEPAFPQLACFIKLVRVAVPSSTLSELSLLMLSY